jgi:hypothetical protein
MPETVTVDGPPVAIGAATVSASALALHLDCSRTYIGKLESEGVIQRQGNGFPLEPRCLPADTCGASGGNHCAPRPTLITRFFSIRRSCTVSTLAPTRGSEPCRLLFVLMDAKAPKG